MNATTATLESRIVDYIRDNSSSGRVLNLSLAKIAEHIDCSVASVHRTVQKLEREGLIQVEKHRAKNKPDTITFLGADADDVLPIVSQLVEQSSNINSLTQSLVSKLAEKQTEVQELRGKLKLYEGRVVIDELRINDDITAVFYRS